MSGHGETHAVCCPVDDPVGDGGHRVVLEVACLAVEFAQYLRGIRVVQRVGAQRAPQPSHDDRGPQSVAGDVADHHAHAPTGQLEHVVPVAADTAFRARDVTGRQFPALRARQTGGEQAFLQHRRRDAFGTRAVHVDRYREAIGHELQRLDLLVGEPARGGAADVHDTRQLPLGDHRHAEQHPQAVLPQQRIDHCGLVDLLDLKWLPGLGDAAREALADRHAHSLEDLLVEARGRSRHQLCGAAIHQQDGDGVHSEQFAGAFQQHLEEFVEVEFLERPVRHRVQNTQADRRTPGPLHHISVPPPANDTTSCDRQFPLSDDSPPRGAGTQSQTGRSGSGPVHLAVRCKGGRSDERQDLL